MKNNIKTLNRVILIVVIVLLSINCSDDFLNQKKLGEETSDVYFNSEDKAVASLTAAYSDLKDYRFCWFYWAFGETLSDNAIYGGSDGDQAGFAPLKAFNANSSAFQVRFKWDLCYRGINKSNQTLEGIESMDKTLFKTEAYRNRLIAEAKVLRAFYHFELVRAYGRIPILDHLIRTTSEKIGQSEIKDVYKFIITDLESAEPHLALRSELTSKEMGHITKGFAQGLLAKVNLYDENYEAAKKWAKKVIDSKEYKLAADFNTIFTLAGENNEESIFELQFHTSSTETSATKNNGNFQTLFMLPRNITYGYGINLPTKDLADAYDKAGDIIRKKATLLSTEEVYANEIPKEVLEEGDEAKIKEWKEKLTFNRTGYYQKKMYVLPKDRSAEIRSNANNIRIMRYSEILLTYAEACAKTGDDSNSQAALNEVRQRVSLPDITATGDDLVKAIWAERRLELAGESDRYHELLRTKQANILEHWTEAHKYWPVPQNEIDKTTGEIEQNPGY